MSRLAASLPQSDPPNKAGDVKTTQEKSDRQDKAEKPQTRAAASQSTPDASPKLLPDAIVPKPHNAMPLKIFFLLVAIGLFTSTLTGLYMSYKYIRNRMLVTALLIAGIVIPVLMTIL